MIDTKIAVVGGGLAGLCAAYRLEQAGVDFVLLEARDRLGGRILTVDESGMPSADGFDFGPSWFWPLPATKAWVSGVWEEWLHLAGSETGASEPGYLAGRSWRGRGSEGDP